MRRNKGKRRENTKPRIKVIRERRRGAFVLRWHDGDRWRQQITGCKSRRMAERQAAEKEAELLAADASSLSWSGLVARYLREHLGGLSGDYQATSLSTIRKFEQIVRPQYADEIDASDLSRFAASLRREDRSESTVRTYLKHLRVMLNWAADLYLIDESPRFRLPKTQRRHREMRSRPPTTEEFERMLAAVPVVRPTDAELWVQYLTGLWLSGLRLDESIRLSWDRGDFRVDLAADIPHYRITRQKSKRDELLPITPDFAALLETFEFRTGRVFRLPCGTDQAGKIVRAIGTAAMIIVNDDGKHVSAHDLRRAFATRWSQKVTPTALRQLMRHRSIETTMKHYVHLDLATLAGELWSQKGGQTGGQAAMSLDNQIAKER